MGNTLTRHEFLVIPVVGVLDEETRKEIRTQRAPITLPDDDVSLGLFMQRWPQQFATLNDQFAKEQEAAAAKQAEAEAAVLLDIKTPRPKRARAVKKAAPTKRTGG